MIEKIKQNKLLLVISLLIVIVVVLLLSRLTYAYLKSETGQSGITEGNITASGDRLIFTKGTDLALNLSTDNFNSSTEGNITASTSPSVTLIANAKTNEAKATYSTGIDITRNTFVSSDNEPELILQVKCDEEEIREIKDLDYNETLNGFDITGKTGIFNAAVDKEITSTDSIEGVTHIWEYTVVLINKEVDQSINENAKFKAKVYIEEVERLPIEEVLLAKANKEGETPTLLHHNGTIKAGDLIIDAQDDSYRYSGSNDIVNNYVCLGTDNNAKGECANNDLYRIIGLFKNADDRYEMKLIKNSPYEGTDAETTDLTVSGKGYYWSGSVGNQSNLWKDSPLNTTVLNTNYIGTLPTYVQNLIEPHNYITEGNVIENIRDKYAYEVYQSEIVNPNLGPFATEEDKTTNAKIGLMYISDYGYAAFQNAWTSHTLLYYNNDIVRFNNWMCINDEKTYEWTITRLSEHMDDAIKVDHIGAVTGFYVYVYVSAVRPVFYLSSNTMLKSGDGSKLNPYRLLVE